MATVSVLNTTAALSGKTLMLAESAQTVTGLWHFDRDPNPPFTVAGGSAKVDNLDADKLDGLDGTAYHSTTSAVVTSSTGPHAIGASTSNRFQFQVAGSYAASGGGTHDVGALFITSLTPQVGVDGSVASVSGTLVEAASGTHTNMAALRVGPPTLTTTGGATTTNAYALLIDGGPTGATNNYALSVASGTTSLGGALIVGSTLLLSNVLTPAQITADQNNYAPGGISSVSVVRLSSDAARNITGISASQTAGRMLLLMNVGTFDIVLVHNSGASTPSNAFFCPGAANFTLNQQDSVKIWYDSTDSRWRVMEA